MFSELHCKTNFSFLSGASHADELVTRAIELGYHALAVTDENTLAGVVKAYGAARKTDLKLIIGAEFIPEDAPPVVLWASDRKGYGRLSRLLTLGRKRAAKGECRVQFEDVASLSEGLLAGAIPHLPGDRARSAHTDWKHGLHDWRELFGDRAYLLASLYQGVDDAWRLQQLAQLSQQTNLPMLATGDVLYHSAARMPLHDVLTAIKHRTNVIAAGDLLLPNAQRHLKKVAHYQTVFADFPEAIERTREVADRCSFCLSELRYEYPREFASANQTSIEYLTELTWEGARQRYPNGVSAKVKHQIEHELKLIDELRYEAYFLTVWDLVRYARSRDILCQGRGSAANSAVCYCLGVTSVDPDTTDLLFERFISKERDEAPDIDVDFEHERREEVLQYLYEKYGRHRAGLAATVVTYRSRSAVRDVGKALGLSLDRVDALAKTVGVWYSESFEDGCKLKERMPAAGVDPESAVGRQLLHLTHELVGFPRHLSQHVGGMVITEGRLDELVPIENAAMEDRTVIQWDKNDLEEMGLLKVDCLCLGMLTALRKGFRLIDDHHDQKFDLATVPGEDPLVYDMICKADTVGVFQIESRAQMSMLPRLKPRCWYDLVIQVAIVRPGPIQGNMVHPFLRSRNGEIKPNYPNDEIRAVLERTMGVPIFQEQAMKLAVVAAGFTPGEADQLRRAMGAWRKSGTIEKFRHKLYEGMKARGLSQEFADQVFHQIRGFGEYGFPESHAASFAHLAYVSSWMKCHYPAAFCVAILNSQPMGFYTPAQLVADAKAHGVTVLPPDVNRSDWDSTLEHAKDSLAIRLGMRLIGGLRHPHAQAIMDARQVGVFESIADFTRRTELGQATVSLLSEADAFASVGQDRRAALWQALAQEKRPLDQPLFAGLDVADDDANLLPDLPLQEQVFEDYRTVGLSLKAHPISFHREYLDELRVTPIDQLEDRRDGQHLRIAGLVTLRQRPATAKGMMFVTLEDETGTANLVVKPSIRERYYKITRQSSAWIAHGKLERRSNVTHVLINRIEDLSETVGRLKLKSRNFR